MSAYYEVLFVVWLLLLAPVVIKSIKAVSASQSTSSNNQHLEIITTDDESICTTNGIYYVLFLDQSRLDEANSKRLATEAAYEKVAMGFCQTQCNLVCATENLPLCAVDTTTGLQRTFNNPCEMSRDACLNNIAWKLQATGPCSAMQERTNPILMEPRPNPTKKGRKPIYCTKIFNPVCAIFAGVKSTFNNECLVNAENVKTGNDWIIFSHGVCAEDYSSFGYNANQIKYNNIRSFDKTIYQGKQGEANRYYDDMMTFIYAPLIQTEYVDEAFAQNFYDPTAMLGTNFNQHQFQQLLGTQTARAQTHRPIRLVDNHNKLDRVSRCKYGSEPICGIFKNIYHSFDNVCELMLRNILLNQTWITAYAGYCLKNNCPQVCTEDYEPICVSKNDVNLTVSNSCYLDMKQCQDPQSTWKIIAKGECGKQKLSPLASTLVKTRNYEYDGLGSRADKKYPTTTTVAPTSSKSDKPNTTTKTLDSTKTSTNLPFTTTASTTITTAKTTTTTTKTTATSASQPITSLSFDIQKSMTTPKHYVSLTTSEATKTTTPITLTPYHTSTKAPVTTFVISAKTAPVTPSRLSIYGANRNSVIMRLVKAKGFSLPKYTSACTL